MTTVEELQSEKEKNLDFAQLDEIFYQHRGLMGTLIPILQKAQHAYGYLPASVMERVAEDLGRHVTEVYGVATFYAMFRLKPVGRYVIRVCQGTACHVKGGKAISANLQARLGIKKHETTTDLMFTIEDGGCVGACAQAPIMAFNDDIYGQITISKATELINAYQQKEV